MNFLSILSIIICAILLSSCSSLKMNRPEPALYKDLQELSLFGLWTNSDTEFLVQCTGGFEYTEMRGGEVFNTDKGGKIKAIDKEKKLIMVSHLFGNGSYSYDLIDKNTISIKANKKSGVIGGLTNMVRHITYVPGNENQYLKRKKLFDCDKAPKNLGEVFGQMRSQMKKGKYKAEGNTVIIEDPKETIIEE